MSKTQTKTIIRNYELLRCSGRIGALGGETSHPEIIERDMIEVDTADTDANRIEAINNVIGGIQWYLDEESGDWGAGETPRIVKARQELAEIRKSVFGR
jgi:hypothetical protein